MATIGELHVKITGIGKSRFGLWLMGVVARVFHIELEITANGGKAWNSRWSKENKRLLEQNRALQHGIKTIAKHAENNGVKLCGSCLTTRVEVAGQWCESCKTRFAYGC